VFLFCCCLSLISSKQVLNDDEQIGKSFKIKINIIDSQRAGYIIENPVFKIVFEQKIIYGKKECT